jgi:hypothetical protein
VRRDTGAPLWREANDVINKDKRAAAVLIQGRVSLRIGCASELLKPARKGGLVAKLEFRVGMQVRSPCVTDQAEQGSQRCSTLLPNRDACWHDLIPNTVTIFGTPADAPRPKVHSKCASGRPKTMEIV